MQKVKTPEGYPFAYETHMHTKQGSRCGSASGADMAKAYKEAGYTGIIITDHFFYGNTAPDRDLPWADWVMEYCKGYEDAKECGDKIGLDVFFGWESGYNCTEFLVYGLDKEWLLAHPEIRDASIPEQFELVHRYGGMVIHAHPFREENYIPEVRLFPEYVDGVEQINMAHFHKKNITDGYMFNQKAEQYAKEHDFPVTGGSDMHSTNLWFGGMAFNRRLENIFDYNRCVMNREGIILTGEFTDE